MTMERKEILAKVREVLVDALCVDEDDVRAETTLMNDLGVESVDFLDIVFRLEKTFGIEVAREELFPAETILRDPELVCAGKVNGKGLVVLREKLPHVNLTGFERDPDINKLAMFFTVDAIVNYVQHRLSTV